MSLAPFYRGKVRDLYAVNDSSFIVVATDRLSAFDVVFPDPIPGKGKILTNVSNLWFQALRLSGLHQRFNFTDHILETNVMRFPDGFQNPDWAGRAVLVKKCKRIDFECVVRGYLAGSAYKEYLAKGTACGIELPAGLKQASRLPEAIFTPATKAETGHDENIPFAQMQAALGPLADRLRDISLAIFHFASEEMKRAGILLCDTKFEFGLIGESIVLIDEALTPDSSRYWDARTYAEGTSPAGFDKQFVRDFVESIGWNKEPPAPGLPGEIIEKTIALYSEIEGLIKATLRL
ncbi:MAG: phosphoribosylaminoimidazolesuccinocarboxamide synthase [Spirochaetia bacterium]|nr:phosphoribosylaminoimidazolesuccinocarboxamide synthase [Spirochaetia bacterium]